jgi:hypothetical protein
MLSLTQNIVNALTTVIVYGCVLHAVASTNDGEFLRATYGVHVIAHPMK